MINFLFQSQKIVPAVTKLLKAVYRLTDEVPYLFAYCALFCPYLHKDKATKQITASGCICEDT